MQPERQGISRRIAATSIRAVVPPRTAITPAASAGGERWPDGSRGNRPADEASCHAEELVSANRECPGMMDTRVRRLHAACGFLLGMLIAVWAEDLSLDVVPALRWVEMPFVAGLLGAALAWTRARAGLLVVGAAVYGALLVVGGTPV